MAGSDGFPGVERTTLAHLERPDGSELVIAEVEYAPGTAAPPHRHPIGGLAYIIDGEAESAHGEETPRSYRSGDVLQDRPNDVHAVFRNVDDERPLRFLTLYAAAPGRPYVEPS